MSPSQFTFVATDEAATERLGQALAQALPGGSVVALNGPLGAGKTRLVQSISVATGVDRRDVVSPTFVLVHEYHGTRPIYHIDAYRLRDEAEFQDLGADEYFRPPNLVLVEWAERIAGCLPREHLEVNVSVAESESRRFQITAHGQRFDELLRQLAGALKE